MGRRKSKVSKQHLPQEDLLQFLKAGLVLTVALVAPNALKGLEPLMKGPDGWDRYYTSTVERGATRLWRKGYVEVIESSQGHQVVISNKGKKLLLEYKLDELSVPKQNAWDGKWRMVFFDIKTRDSRRNLFREKLKSLGFFPMQKSVYVYPYPCSKEIQFLREVMNIAHEVKFAIVEKLENDEDLRRIFKL